MEARSVDAGRGLAWLTCGWRLFMANPGVWVVVGILFLVAVVVLSLIPFLGGLVLALVSPALAAGLLYGAREIDAGRTLDFAHLFVVFRQKEKLNPLLVLGAVALAGAVFSMILAALILGGSMMAMMETGTPEVVGHMGVGFLIGGLVVLAVQLVIAMLLLYAVPLVLFADTLPGLAMRSSFDACLRNFLPLLVFSVLYTLAAIVASLPFMLGWLVLLPASAGMLYCSYKDLYAADDRAGPG